MTEEQLLAFIKRIISSGQEQNIAMSLTELYNILLKDDADQKLIRIVKDLSETAREAKALAEKKNGDDITMEDLASSIRSGRERIERESRRC
ncbi:MAG: hypothetical protein IJ065_08825 [Eubacterium sp.]|nr:hypothetical protein [Eubacterium sp.]